MAFTVTADTKTEIRVIVHKDGAIGDKSKEAYKAYLSSFKSGDGDESLLKLTAEPSRFVMRLVLPYDQTQRLRGRNVTVQGKKLKTSINIMSETVRAHLTGIEHPEGVAPGPIVWKRESDQWTSKMLMGVLDRAHVVNDLFMAVTNANREIAAEAEAQKNS